MVVKLLGSCCSHWAAGVVCGGGVHVGNMVAGHTCVVDSINVGM